MAPKRECKFLMNWLKDSKYRNWLTYAKDIKVAKCKLCMCILDVRTMGKSALDSHMKGMKHKKLVDVPTKLLTSWIHPSNTSDSHSILSEGNQQSSTSSSEQISSSIQQSSSIQKSSTSTIITERPETMQLYNINKESVLTAEIFHTLNIVINHQSFNSSKNSSAVYKVMFPDSQIAQNFNCGYTKVKYLSQFGLAPYYEQKLLTKLDEVPYYSLLFDESLNRQTKNEQMDFSVRYWDTDIHQVVDHYLTSKFIGHATANDLLRCFRDATSNLKRQNVLQVSMDGPNVNHKFYKDLISEREASDPDLPDLIYLGTCGLHVGHGAFRTGFEITGWKIDRLLKSLWYLFNESPARREDFTRITGCSIFPLQFCGVRWVEDCPVAERALFLWGNIEKYVYTIEVGPKKNIPKCSSYKTVSVAVSEPLTCARLQVFINIAKVVQPFLTLFQANKPMAPFLAEEIHKMMKDLMEKFVKKELLSNSISSLMEVDFSDKENHVENKNINIGFAAKGYLSKASVGDARKFEFRHQCLTCYEGILSKLKERSPIKYEFVLHLRSLSPHYIITHPNGSIKCFEKILECLINYKYLNAADCDCILKEYKSLISEIRLEHKERFSEFNLKSDRLDSLFYDLIGVNPKYKTLWNIVKMIFTLSHGQSSIERGFSINKNVSKTNMNEDTIIAERIICDGVMNELKREGCDDISKINVDKEMLKYCSRASSSYKAYLLKNKEDNKKSAVETKKVKIREELESEKNNKKKYVKLYERHLKNADDLALKAQVEEKLALLKESNESRKRSLEVKESLEASEAKIIKLKEELKKLT